MTKGDASKVYPDEIRFPAETVPDAEEGGGARESGSSLTSARYV